MEINKFKAINKIKNRRIHLIKKSILTSILLGFCSLLLLNCSSTSKPEVIMARDNLLDSLFLDITYEEVQENFPKALLVPENISETPLITLL